MRNMFACAPINCQLARQYWRTLIASYYSSSPLKLVRKTFALALYANIFIYSPSYFIAFKWPLHDDNAAHLGQTEACKWIVTLFWEPHYWPRHSRSLVEKKMLPSVAGRRSECVFMLFWHCRSSARMLGSVVGWYTLVIVFPQWASSCYLSQSWHNSPGQMVLGV